MPRCPSGGNEIIVRSLLLLLLLVRKPWLLRRQMGCRWGTRYERSGWCVSKVEGEKGSTRSQSHPPCDCGKHLVRQGRSSRRRGPCGNINQQQLSHTIRKMSSSPPSPFQIPVAKHLPPPPPPPPSQHPFPTPPPPFPEQKTA